MNDDKERENSREYRGPAHPKEVDDFAKCAKWEEQFVNYCLSRSAMRALRTGEAGSYSSTVEELLISTVSAEKNKGKRLKAKVDKVVNGKLFGWLCQATENTAPSLYRKIRNNTDVFDPNNEAKEEGLGNKAWDLIRVSLRLVHADPELTLTAVDTRDEFGKSPIKM